MREGGAKGKTTEGRRGRVDVKESMTYCAPGRLASQPAGSVTCCYEPRPVPNQHFLPQDPSPHPLSCAINDVAPFPAPP